jgi:hypothetical protein
MRHDARPVCAGPTSHPTLVIPSKIRVHPIFFVRVREHVSRKRTTHWGNHLVAGLGSQFRVVRSVLSKVFSPSVFYPCFIRG